jgi:hypothetical protein
MSANQTHERLVKEINKSAGYDIAAELEKAAAQAREIARKAQEYLDKYYPKVRA